MHVTLYGYNGDSIGRVELRRGRVVVVGQPARTLLDGLVVGLDGERVWPREGERYLRAVARSLPRSSLVES